MTKKLQKPTVAPAKAAPLNRRKASTPNSVASVSTANDRRVSLPPQAEAPTPDVPEGGSGLAPARARAKRPAAAPRRRAASAPSTPVSHVILPAPAVEVPTLPTASAPQADVVPEPTHDEVATRAYFIALAREGAPGNPDHDWMVALTALRRERGLQD